MRIPVLTQPVLTSPSGHCLLGATEEQWVQRHWLDIVHAILFDAVSLEQLVEEAARSRPDIPRVDLAARLVSSAKLHDNLLRIVDVDVPPAVDIILLCQGYGGVYVHTLELLNELSENKKCSILLLSPVDPLFGYRNVGRHTQIITLPSLARQGMPLPYVSYVQLVRAIIKNIAHSLLYIEHRSQTLFVFDLVQQAKRGTIIHDDGYYDAAYHASAAARIQLSERRRRRVLREIYHVLRYNAPEFCGISPSPLNNRYLREAGWIAMRNAAENWCWSYPAYASMAMIYKNTRTRVRFVPPFVAPVPKSAPGEYQPFQVLFTTTMHNIKKKGLILLCRALRILPSHYTVLCIVSQPQHLPRAIPRNDPRLIIRPGVSKSEFRRLLGGAAVYCRVSRDESSPLSLVEALAAGLPVITSTRVQQNLPLLCDGKTGYILRANATPVELADRIRSVCENTSLRARMSDECRRAAASIAFPRDLFAPYVSGAE